MYQRKLAASLAVAALAVVGLIVPTTAFASDDAQEEQIVFEFEPDPKFAEELSSATAQNVGTGEVITPFYDPPLGGCDWSEVGGNIEAIYLDGFLSDLEANFLGRTVCLTTAPGQSMEHMSTVTRLFRSGTMQASGIVDDCNYAPGNNCTSVLSLGIHICVGGLLCEGVYQVAQAPTMYLPDGWVWTSWPESCVNLGDRELQCISWSTTMVIPLLYPG